MFSTRFSQADYEARVILLLYAAFFLWWTIGAFGLGEYAQTPVFGMPAWFFVSCVLSYPLVCVALWITVRLCFKDMPLDGHLDKDDHLGKNGHLDKDAHLGKNGHLDKDAHLGKNGHLGKNDHLGTDGHLGKNDQRACPQPLSPTEHPHD